ncbi:MAG: protein kinase [Pirellulales bacterium]
MSEPPISSPHHVRISRADPLDRLCDDFEQAWRQGEPPRLEQFLQGLVEPERVAAFRKLLVIEISCRLRAGESPAAPEYEQRFPQYAALVSGHFEGSTKNFSQTPTHVNQTFQGPAPGAVTASTRFEQLQYRAEGGLGEVFFAHDVELHRGVALKFIKPQLLADPASRERLVFEAEVTGRLDHPGVVPVYAIGEDWNRRPFYAMRFIEGSTMRQAIDDFHKADWSNRRRERRLALHTLLEHFIAACNTVAYAHNRGIVHRDIKPENIMLGRFRETLVVDWGLAVSVDRDDRAVSSGEPTLRLGSVLPGSSACAGTIGYMSPEHLPDSFFPLGPASDIYSLGATLYKLLAGVRPLADAPDDSVWERIRSGRVARPTELRRDIPRALEAVCLKAMATRPTDRYASAQDLAQDVQCWLSDEGVSVYREPWFERLSRSARRHRGWTQSIAAATLLVLATAIFAGVSQSRMANREHDARIAAQQAEQESLQLAAHFAASAIADEVDLRWQILETAAEDQALRPLLGGPDAPNDDTAAQLQNWLQQQADVYVASGYSNNWFLTDARGVQVARVPRDRTIGSSFAYRDYFHGQGKDFKADELPDELGPIERPYRSAAFVSQATGNPLLIAFTAPVFAAPQGDKRPVVGVLGMTMDVARWNKLVSGMGTQRVAMLVDLKPDQIEGPSRSGLVVQYDDVVERRFLELNREQSKPVFRLDPRQVVVCQRLCDRLVAQHASAVRIGPQPQTLATAPGPDNLRRDFLDPTEPGSSPSPAIFEPVVIQRRQGAEFDTGWMVIVRQRLPRAE